MFTFSVHFRRKRSIADIMKEVKAQSSKWVKTKDPSMRKFEWQRGYGIFSVNPSGATAVQQYIAGQEEHHKRTTFTEEYREFLKRHQVEYDERYVWN